jgi:hypothetical protein
MLEIYHPTFLSGRNQHCRQRREPDNRQVRAILDAAISGEITP